MEFGLNSDQQMLQSTLSEFARRELAPPMPRATRTWICRAP